MKESSQQSRETPNFFVSLLMAPQLHFSLSTSPFLPSDRRVQKPMHLLPTALPSLLHVNFCVSFKSQLKGQSLPPGSLF